ncbi:hypothetical protein T439DRAFT_375738 [Meredithblackwellia eburnea MCA 4105]
MVRLITGSLALFALFVQAVQADATLPYNVDNPAATPSFAAPPQPTYLPLSHVARSLKTTLTERDLTGNELMSGELLSRDLTPEQVGEDMVRRAKVDLLGERSGDVLPDSVKARNVVDFERRDRTFSRFQLKLLSTCVDGTANDTYISSLFYYGGAGTTVLLCQGVTISLTNAIFFSAANQTLATVGYPQGALRATVKVTGSDQSCAIYGAIGGGDNIALRNIQVAGSRDTLGRLATGIALIEMGGTNTGQIIDSVRSYEPRGWSAMHAIEGYENSCSGMQITNNDVGPSGHAPSGAQQFRRRGQDTTGTYAPGEWADGISLACKGSLVEGNIITDATDGAIVVFGAPGSTITGNTVQAVNRQLLGGINMVDWSPFSGSFEGTVVKDNTIWSRGQFIKTGIPAGGMIWGVDNRTLARTFAGTVTGNTFLSTAGGYFGYAIAASGHENITVSGNNAKRASFGGVDSSSCFTSWFPLPTPQSFIRDPYTTPGGTWQSGFYSLVVIVLAICKGPGAIIAKSGVGA